ncbi:hypothetical protein HAX54_008594 [Datura stramonium]|uniref:Uncharacterized protein n=1 Tax=Datura stramonium TaxID=4076 RepID=A0ABS8TDG4_DATST|nr:hypothetical protein [Datura stramonium]
MVKLEEEVVTSKKNKEEEEGRELDSFVVEVVEFGELNFWFISKSPVWVVCMLEGKDGASRGGEATTTVV